MSDVDQLRQDLSLVELRWQEAFAERDGVTHDPPSAEEESHALNAAVSDSNRELRRLNDRLAGLVAGATVPVVVVDQDLNIRCMTAAAEHPFNIGSADTGRPIAEAQSRLGVDLEPVVRQVIESSAASEIELLDKEGVWQLLRVRPWRVDRRISGATLTLIDIDRLQRDKFAESIIESMPTPLLVLGSGRRVRAANRSFLEFYGLRAADVEDRNIGDIGAGQFRLPDLDNALARLAKGETAAEELECVQTVPHGGERALLIVVRCVRQAGSYQFLLAIHDTTEQKQQKKDMALALHQTEDALRVSHEDLRALTQRLLHAQDEERRRISRELHDDLSQNVACLQFDLEVLAKSLPTDLGKERRSLSSIQESVARLAEDLRRIAYGLHPSTLEILGLAGALGAYAREFSQRTGIAVDFSAAGVPPEISPGVVSAFYRIAQEALRNVARHASTSAEIRLTGENSLLTLSIRDNGPGFDREAVRGKGGLGLVSMEERARLIRARFEIDTAPGRGVSITVAAPLT